MNSSPATALEAGSSVFPTVLAALIFVVGAALLLWGQRIWLKRIDLHPLLNTQEKLQNKDALVIGTFFVIVLLLALCVAGAGAAHLFSAHSLQAVQLTLVWALAASVVGAAFGFLLGHPRRTAEDKVGKEERTGTNWLLRTGLDDMVDWLVKGLTTVLLVQSATLIEHIGHLSTVFSAGLQGPATGVNPVGAAFAQPIIVFFTLFGALAGCLVTRTYLTGALGRADRTTVGAFTNAGLSFSEALLLLRHQRSLGSRGQGQLSPEVARVGAKLAGLAIEDLRTPQEFALWAKAKSALAINDAERKQALDGYAKAIALCECDPALSLDYAVALHAAGDSQGALQQLEQAALHLSAATPAETRKNVYKSLTYSLLYLQPPQSFERTLKILQQYERDLKENLVLESGSVRVNEACAYGAKFRWLVQSKGLLETPEDQPLLVKLPADRNQWPKEFKDTFDAALNAIKRTLAIDRAWMGRFHLLLLHNHKEKTAGGPHAHYDDLEVFERFPEFRDELGLPPWTDAPPPPPKDSGQEQDVEDEQADPGADIEGEKVPLDVIPAVGEPALEGQIPASPAAPNVPAPTQGAAQDEQKQ